VGSGGHRNFPAGNPPELVIEILSTRRGNVERTEKIDDYGCAGSSEYWIVNPFDRVVEVYLLRGREYQATQRDPNEPLRPQAFAGVAIDPRHIWTALDERCPLPQPAGGEQGFAGQPA
jgi:Uma2 family endonuclease